MLTLIRGTAGYLGIADACSGYQLVGLTTGLFDIMKRMGGLLWGLLISHYESDSRISQQNMVELGCRLLLHLPSERGLVPLPKAPEKETTVRSELKFKGCDSPKNHNLACMVSLPHGCKYSLSVPIQQALLEE